MNIHKKILSVFAATAISFVGTNLSAEEQEQTLNTVSFLPSSSDITVAFLNFVKDVNEQGKGIVQINYRGGPEAVPSGRIGQSVQSGAIDMAYVTPSRFTGIVPEADALLGTNRHIRDLHENGAIEMLDTRMRERMNSHLLGVFFSGTGFHIFTNERPSYDSEGMFDFDGMNLRTSATYREFLDEMNANSVSISAGEIYTSMERGVVSGFGWPEYGVLDLGVGELLKYRLDPSFFNANNVVIINQDKWKGLSSKAQRLLTQIARDHEIISTSFIRNVAANEEAELIEMGMEIVDAKIDPEIYQNRALEVVWDRLESRVPEVVDSYRSLFMRELE